MTFTFTANYNEELAQYIDELFTQDKADKLSRQCRLQASDSLIESYVKHTGLRPPSAQLGRLATLILRDELADPHPDKMSREDSPILSGNQYRRRTEGKHVNRRNSDGTLRPLTREVPFSLATNIGIDGKDYSYPNRRIVDVQEQMDIEYNGKESRADED